MSVEKTTKSNNEQELHTSPFPFGKSFFEFTFKKEVEKIEVKEGTNPGDNYLSIIHAADVTYRGEKSINHYLIKCYPNHPFRIEFLDKLKVFQKELFIYKTYFPELLKLAVDICPTDPVQLSVPYFHFGNTLTNPEDYFKTTPWGTENFILMTDMRHENYQMANRVLGLDIEHAKLVIKELAKFHALGWAYKEKNRLELLSKKFPILVDEMYSAGTVKEIFKELMDNINAGVVQIIEEALGADHPACVGFKTVLELGYFEIVQKFMKPHGITEKEYEDILRFKPENDPEYNSEPWLTSNHSDCHVNNLLFRYDTAHKPIEVAFVDFQICREACPTNDLAYFLYSSVRAPIRTEFKFHLLSTYHDAFLFYCKKLNVAPYPGFSIKSLKRRFHRSELFGFIVAVPLLNLMMKSPEQGIDLEKQKGNAADLFNLLKQGVDKTKIYQDEIIASILDLHNTGVI